MPSLMAAATVAAVLAVTAAAGADLTGGWSLELDPGFNDAPATLQCDVTQEGRQLTLECDDLPVVAGTVEDDRVKFVIMTGADHLLAAQFSGTLDANGAVINGTWRLEDTTGNRIGRFRAEKKK